MLVGPHWTMMGETQMVTPGSHQANTGSLLQYTNANDLYELLGIFGCVEFTPYLEWVYLLTIFVFPSYRQNPT